MRGDHVLMRKLLQNFKQSSDGAGMQEISWFIYADDGIGSRHGGAQDCEGLPTPGTTSCQATNEVVPSRLWIYRPQTNFNVGLTLVPMTLTQRTLGNTRLTSELNSSHRSLLLCI